MTYIYICCIIQILVNKLKAVKKSHFTKIFLILAIFSLFGGYFGNVNIAEAAAPTCPLSTNLIIGSAPSYVINFGNTKLFSDRSPRTLTKNNVSVPAGVYSIQAVTWDDHSVHGDQNQQLEKVKFTFYNGSTRVGNTSATDDISPSQNYKTTNLGNRTLSQDVTKILVEHAVTAPLYQSVVPVCMKLTRISDVPPTLEVSCSASPSSAETGDNVTWNANASGGTGTFTYSWSGANTNGNTTNSVTKSYTTAGNKTATVTVKSGNQTKKATCSANITNPPVVIPTLTGSCSASPNSATTGQNVYWNASPSGGTGSYTYSWSGGETDGKTTKNFNKVYSTTGTKNATVMITSGSQTTTVNCSANITSVPVTPPTLTASCSASPNSTNTGNNVTWDADAAGGTGTYSYSWNTGNTSENFTTSYNTTGSRTNTVTVTSGSQTATATCSANITSTPTPPSDDLDVTCRVSDTTIREGDSVTFEADIDGGNSPYEYDWGLDISGDDETETVRFNNEGTYRARITVTDDDGNTASDTCPIVYVDEDDNNDDDLRVICRVSDRDIEEGDTVRFEADVDGGNSPYDYDWRGDIDGDDRIETVRFNRSGNYEVSIRVRDDDGNTATDDCPDIDVEDDNGGGSITVNTNNNNPPSGNLAALNSVFLSQVPYTGAKETLAIIGFIAAIFIWSVLIVFFLVRKKKKALRQNNISAFKELNKTSVKIN